MSQSLQERITAFPFWYHKIELPGGIVTPGWAPINQASYGIPQDLTGKRVLDVGAWDGYWSFEALKRGAKEVVAIDDFSDYLGHLENNQRCAWDTFDLCREALGYSEDICQRIRCLFMMSQKNAWVGLMWFFVLGRCITCDIHF